MPDLHAALTAAAVWPADLVTAGVVSSASQVYTGRRRQGVTRMDREVWLERLAVEQAGTGLQGLSRHPYMLHLICKSPSNAGPAKTGQEQLDAIQDDLQTIADRYSGSCPFKTAITTMVHAEAEEDGVDDNTDETSEIEGTVRVTFTVTR